MAEGKNQGGLSLFEAARRMGVTFQEEVQPEDKFITIDGLRLHYLDWGNRHLPPMVLLHGGAQTAHSWDFFALSMRQRYHVLALDQRGHGDSDWHPEGDYSVEAHIKDIAGFVDALSLPPLILIGLSMGGRNSFTYTATHPGKVKALVIVDVGPETMRPGVARIQEFTSGPREFDSIEEIVQRAYRYDPRRPIEQFRGSVRNNVKQLPNGKWIWKYDWRFRGGKTSAPDPGAIARAWEHIKSIRCPALIVRGGESDVLSPEIAQRMVQVMANAQVVEVPGAGHLVQGDNPLGFEKAVRAFLDSLHV